MKHPWLKFYPADWRADPRLRMCSLAARGLWIDLMAYMHEGKPYGHLTIDGILPAASGIASLVGRPVNEVVKALAELEAHYVFSRTDAGAIFSRRMVKDHDRSEEGREHIERRWAKSTPISPPNRSADRAADRAADRGAVSEPITQKLEARDQSQDKEPSLRSVARKRATTLPDDWDPGPEGRAFAKANGLDAQKTGFEIQRFRDHAKANGRTQKDWPAAWRNWVTSPYQSRASPNGFSSAPPRPGSKEDMRERSADAYRKLSEYVDANADEPSGSGGPREANAGLLPFAKPA